QISLIQRPESERGLAASIIQGILLTNTSLFVVLDADFQHPPAAVIDIVKSLRDDNDLVVGIRSNRKKLTLARRISSWGAHTLASTYLRIKGRKRTKDTMSGFFGGRTEFCKKIIMENQERFEKKGFKILFDLLKFSPKSVRIGEVEFEFGERRGGASKLDARVVLSIMRQCGIAGRIFAAATSFFLLNWIGRFIAAFILGIFTTMLFLMMMGQPVQRLGIFPTVVSFLLAVGYVVAANKFFSEEKENIGIIRGLQTMFIAFSGFILNLVFFYLIALQLPDLQLMPMLIGFALAVVYDTFGSRIGTHR
ncbi:MAG: glycosyltransferase, partial [Methanomassiliicoccales archaeon]